MIQKDRLTVPKKKLYVGCSLTHAPKEFVERVEQTKKALSKDWEIMHFLGLGVGTSKGVYQQDILVNVAGCDAFLGIADEPAWGLGFETAKALEFGKPTLMVAHKDSKITRLMLGVSYFEAGFSFVRYEDMTEDVPKIVREEFARVLRSSNNR